MMVEPASKFGIGTAEEDVRLRESARKMLSDLFGDLAGSEALTRALVAERTEKREDADMWIDVYRLICAEESKDEGSPVVRL